MPTPRASASGSGWRGVWEVSPDESIRPFCRCSTRRSVNGSPWTTRTTGARAPVVRVVHGEPFTLRRVEHRQNGRIDSSGDTSQTPRQPEPEAEALGVGIFRQRLDAAGKFLRIRAPVAYPIEPACIDIEHLDPK